MCDAARFIKIEAAAAAKSTALGRAAKRPYKSPNAACPTGWVRQAQTVIRLMLRSRMEKLNDIVTVKMKFFLWIYDRWVVHMKRNILN